MKEDKSVDNKLWALSQQVAAMSKQLEAVIQLLASINANLSGTDPEGDA